MKALPFEIEFDFFLERLGREESVVRRKNSFLCVATRQQKK
jgi:hypothetical protein